MAINAWVDKTVDAHVETATEKRKKVPVIFSSGERFATSKTKKALRDDNGVIILPMMSIRRTGISPNMSMQALGTETPNMQFAKRIDQKSNLLQNLEKSLPISKRGRAKTVYEVYTMPFPDRSVFNYELIVQTQFTTQMNSIIEKFVHELDIQKSFVAPLENDDRHPQIGVQFEDRIPLKREYVVGFFDAELSDGGNLDEFTDQERIVKWTTSITVPATLQLDPEGEKPSIQVERTSFDMRFGTEVVGFVDDPMELELIFGDGRIRER